MKILHNSDANEQIQMVCNHEMGKTQLRVYVGKNEAVPLVPFGECREFTALRISVEPRSRNWARDTSN